MRRPARLAAVAVLLPVLALGACSKKKDTATPAPSGGSTSSAPATKVKVVVGSAGFDESVLIGYLYGGALEKAGVEVSYKAKLGPRETTQPAIESGQVDLMPEYAGNLLTALDAKAEKPGDVPTLVDRLKALLNPKGVTVSAVSNATDGDVLAVTKATADKYHLTKISDLKAVGKEIVFAGPAECKTRITCLKGLTDIYGITFKEFRPVDELGIRKSSLISGQVQLARLFSADADIKAKDLVLLEDDLGIQPAGNVIAEIRTDKATTEVLAALDKVSQTLTTDDLIRLNDEIFTKKRDVTEVAAEYLQQKGIG
jgi:osmoprotectant transport system substrate-binding protein